MATAAPSTALVTIQPAFTDAERLALAGFLAGVSRPDPRGLCTGPAPVHTWCRARSLALFAVRRPPRRHRRLGPARDLEARGRARATVTRRLRTIAGFYKYAVEEELLDHSPAVHVRRPRVDYEFHATALDRNELGALLVAAGLRPPPEHPLISPLALNGLVGNHRRRHRAVRPRRRTLTITHKGGKVVLIPLAPRTARTIDLASANAPKDLSSWPRTGGGWTGTAPGGSSARSPPPESARPSRLTRSGTRSLPPRK